MENNYSVTVKETSRDLTRKEKVMLKNLSAAVKIHKMTAVDALIIKPTWYAVLEIHNDKAKPQDYMNYVLVDEDGQMYVTGSESFFNSFCDIWNEMYCGDEDWELKIFQASSKNREGKTYITCTVV